MKLETELTFWIEGWREFHKGMMLGKKAFKWVKISKTAHMHSDWENAKNIGCKNTGFGTQEHY